MVASATYGKIQKRHTKTIILIAPTPNDKFYLPDGSNSILIIQGFFECIMKKHET